MKKLILLNLTSVVLLTIFTFPSEAHYVAPVKPKIPTTNELITRYAAKYRVSEKVMHRVIKCESTYNPKAIGDGGKSHGLVQIHLPSHPKVTKVQARNPEFAIDFLAKNLAKGKGRMWTCYRIHYS